MENIYKIKIRSTPNPTEPYPSERRYSASIVLGLSVLFLFLGLTAALMGSLVVRRLAAPPLPPEVARLLLKVERDLPAPHLRPPALLSAACLLMALAHLLAALAGLVASRRWYVDRNITLLFLAAAFATVTSALALLIVALVAALGAAEVVGASLAINVGITALLGTVWAALAARVAYRGMKNGYPEEAARARGGKVEVNRIRKGNRIGDVVPPDILRDFPKSGKLAKFLPSKEGGSLGLPKMESCGEYQERVKKFLTEGGNHI